MSTKRRLTRESAWREFVAADYEEMARRMEQLGQPSLIASVLRERAQHHRRLAQEPRP